MPSDPNCLMAGALQIDGFIDYVISSDGAVWRRLKDKRSPHYPFRPIKHITVDGYPCVNLYKPSKGQSRGSANTCRMFKVHRLVAMAFLPPPLPHQTCVRHLDGDKANCRASNLMWGTYKDNEMDKVAHGTNGKKISQAALVEIRRELAGASLSQIAIGKRHGVCQQTISDIATGKIWKTA